MAATRELTASEREWLRVRDYLVKNRYELGVSAADDFPADMQVAGTPLLAPPSWIPERPLPLGAIDLEFRPEAEHHGVTGTEATWLPERPDGSRYATYSEVMGELAAPTVFENRSTYSLLEADLSGERGRLVFGRGKYFDSINTGEAAAHEYAAARLGSDTCDLRKAIGDPCDLTRRPVNLAISTLTVRRERDPGDSTFLLHWRDPAKVGHAGGLYQVIPVGVFQPSGEASWNERNDFSLWRNMLREFAEELAGGPERNGDEKQPIDYGSWTFARAFCDGQAKGSVSRFCLGLGVDPLTYAADLLTIVVIESSQFDELFNHLTEANEEGSVLAAQSLNTDTLVRLVQSEKMQAAGAGVLAQVNAYLEEGGAC